MHKQFTITVLIREAWKSRVSSSTFTGDWGRWCWWWWASSSAFLWVSKTEEKAQEIDDLMRQVQLACADLRRGITGSCTPIHIDWKFRRRSREKSRDRGLAKPVHFIHEFHLEFSCEAEPRQSRISHFRCERSDSQKDLGILNLPI